MFDKEFYPTPRAVLERMRIDCDGKNVLEPSAGSGNMIEFVKEFGAKQVIACEKNADLRKILAHKCNIISDDFFTVRAEQVSHIDLIVMNPPFSNADKHILHAWKIAPEGCEIIALCNWQTVENRSYMSREELAHLINDYGNKENLGDCFSNADRRTNVEVGLIHLFKPAISEGFDFDCFYFTEEENTNVEGVMPYNEIRAIVNSYVAAVKCFGDVKSAALRLKQYTDVVNWGDVISFSGRKNDHAEAIVTKEGFAKQLQIHCWKHVFDRLNVQKYVTRGVMKNINAFVETQKAYPFTMRNVYRMIEIIVGTRENTMNRAIVEAIDNFTRYTHENRYGVKGWKTNEGHLLAKKFISGWIAETNFNGGLRVKDYNTNFDYVIDLTKALCYITATNFDDIPRISNITEKPNNFERNTWYTWGFFEFKLFKKGTGHFKFKYDKVWERLNRAYAKAKGQVLPEKI